MNECVTLHLEFNRRNPTGKETRTRFLDREYLRRVYATVKNCCSPLCAWICQLFSDIWKHLIREPYFISDCLLLWVNFRAFRLEIGYSRYEILGLPNTVCHILFSINQSQCFYIVHRQRMKRWKQPIDDWHWNGIQTVTNLKIVSKKWR